MATEILIVGGGLSGVAAALAVAAAGRRVVLSEALPWLGGQLTAQAVPPDEHPWVEYQLGSRSYSQFREKIRQHYREHYPLTPAARADTRLNPGAGNVNTLCHEPHVAAAVIEQQLAAYVSAGRIWLLRGYEPVAAECTGDRIDSVTLRNRQVGHDIVVTFDLVIDATELGDLLALAKVEHVTGAESQADTGELHALEVADPLDQQAITWCFAVDHLPGEDHVVARPAGYDHWRRIQIPSWPGPQFSWTVSDHVTHRPRVRQLFDGEPDQVWAWDLWHARRIAARRQHADGFFTSDITLANWPQMDYWAKPVLGVDDESAQAAMAEAKEVSLAFLYWMQTEAPRPDGGQGYPGLRLRPNVTGTHDGFAMQPYFRESRRIVPEFRVLEQHIGVEARGSAGAAETFADSVGIGAYRIDIHPTSTGRNTVDIDSYPFQIPLGALIPARVENLLAAGKNIGTTRITNGAYRVHPVEWSIGEAAGVTAAQAVQRRTTPRAIRNRPSELLVLQGALTARGVDLRWPSFAALTPTSRSGWVEA
ncbi:FAD-dependent oxidoreductase [Geodermatophilus ruber]|nr:FAD-dependent oxidoreductase [Geodermatophilus ruber]